MIGSVARKPLRFASIVGERFIQTKSIARTFQSVDEALGFYDNNVQLGITQLEPLLSQIAYLQSKDKLVQASGLAESDANVFKDSRFTQLLIQAKSDMGSCDSTTMSRFAKALSNLSLPRGGCEEVSELARKIGEVACKRPNAFSPTTLATLAYGLSTRGVSDPIFVEFVKLEALKLVSDLSPENALMILESFRRMNVFDRMLVDNLVERLSDEVERFAAKDIVNCIVIFSKLGLGRGFLLKRLTKLSFENLDMFDTNQVVKMFVGLGKLRFLTNSSVETVLNHIEKIGTKALSANRCGEIIFAFALSGFDKPAPSVVNRLVNRLVGNKLITSELSYTVLVDTVWGLLLMDYAETERLAPMIQKIFDSSPPSNRIILLKALEIANAVSGSALFKSVDISTQWRSAMDDAEKMEVNRFESARLHNEVLALVESIDPADGGGPLMASKITLQRGAKVGGFRCDFFDESKKLAIDIDTLARPTTLSLKHRQLLGEGYATVALDYWEIRRFKNFEEQQAFLKQKIRRALSNRQKFVRKGSE